MSRSDKDKKDKVKGLSIEELFDELIEGKDETTKYKQESISMLFSDLELEEELLKEDELKIELEKKKEEPIEITQRESKPTIIEELASILEGEEKVDSETKEIKDKEKLKVEEQPQPEEKQKEAQASIEKKEEKQDELEEILAEIESLVVTKSKEPDKSLASEEPPLAIKKEKKIDKEFEKIEKPKKRVIPPPLKRKVPAPSTKEVIYEFKWEELPVYSEIDILVKSELELRELVEKNLDLRWIENNLGLSDLLSRKVVEENKLKFYEIALIKESTKEPLNHLIELLEKENETDLELSFFRFRYNLLMGNFTTALSSLEILIDNLKVGNPLLTIYGLYYIVLANLVDTYSETTLNKIVNTLKIEKSKDILYLLIPVIELTYNKSNKSLTLRRQFGDLLYILSNIREDIVGFESLLVAWLITKKLPHTLFKVIFSKSKEFVSFNWYILLFNKWFLEDKDKIELNITQLPEELIKWSYTKIDWKKEELKLNLSIIDYGLQYDIISLSLLYNYLWTTHNREYLCKLVKKIVAELNTPWLKSLIIYELLTLPGVVTYEEINEIISEIKIYLSNTEFYSWLEKTTLIQLNRLNEFLALVLEHPTIEFLVELLAVSELRSQEVEITSLKEIIKVIGELLSGSDFLRNYLINQGIIKLEELDLKNIDKEFLRFYVLELLSSKNLFVATPETEIREILLGNKVEGYIIAKYLSVDSIYEFKEMVIEFVESFKSKLTVPLLYSVALSLLEQKDYVEATHLLDILKQTEPESLLYLFPLEKIYLENKELDSLERLYNDIAKKELSKELNDWLYLKLYYILQGLNGLGLTQNLIADSLVNLSKTDIGTFVIVDKLISSFEKKSELITLLKKLLNQLEGKIKDYLTFYIGELYEEVEPVKAVELYKEYIASSSKYSSQATLRLEKTLAKCGRWVELAEKALEELKNATTETKEIFAYEKLAEIDEQRGDTASLILNKLHLLEIYPEHILSLHNLAFKFLREERFDELSLIYEKLAKYLNDPREACYMALEALRFKEITMEEGGRRITNYGELLKEALKRFPNSRFALGLVEYISEGEGDKEWLLKTYEYICNLYKEPLVQSIYNTKKGDILREKNELEEALSSYKEVAKSEFPEPLAFIGWLETSYLLNNISEVVNALIAYSKFTSIKEYKTQFLYTAIEIIKDILKDEERLIEAYKEILNVDPSQSEAFEKLKLLLIEKEKWKELIEVVEMMINSTTNEEDLVPLYLLQADCYKKIEDTEKAVTCYNKILEINPEHEDALLNLAKIKYQFKEWEEALMYYIRFARVSKDRDQIKETFLKLGEIYNKHLPDVKRAIMSYEKVIEIDEQSQEALENLALLHYRENDWEKAAYYTTKLYQLVKGDIPKEKELLIRLSNIYEYGFNDYRNAEKFLKLANKLDPLNINIIGELAQFYSRRDAKQDLIIHLDMSAVKFREEIDKNPLNFDALHALFNIFTWRGNIDAAGCVVGVLNIFGEANKVELALLKKEHSDTWALGPTIADRSIEEFLSPAGLTKGIRDIFEYFGRNLESIFPINEKEIGLVRSNKLDKSHKCYVILEGMLRWFNLKEVDLYVTDKVQDVIISEKWLVFREDLKESLSEDEFSYLFAYALKQLQTGFNVLIRLNGEQSCMVWYGLIKSFLKDFTPPNIDEETISTFSEKIKKVIPRKLKDKLEALVLENAGDTSIEPQKLPIKAQYLCDRVGMLASGSIATSFNCLYKLINKKGENITIEDMKVALTENDRFASLYKYLLSASYFQLRGHLGLTGGTF